LTDEERLNEVDGKTKYIYLLRTFLISLVFFFMALFGILWAYAMLRRPFYFFKIKMWKLKNYLRYQKFLSDKYGRKSNEYTRLLEDPKKMNEDNWEEFDGGKYPKIKDVEFDQKWYHLIFPEIIFLFFVVFQVLIFLVLLEELF